MAINRVRRRYSPRTRKYEWSAIVEGVTLQAANVIDTDVLVSASSMGANVHQTVDRMTTT